MGNDTIQSVITPKSDLEYTFGYNPTAGTLAKGSVVCLDKDDVDGVDLTLPTALEGNLICGILAEAVTTLKPTHRIVRRGMVDALVDGNTVDVAVGDVLVPTTAGTLVSGLRQEVLNFAQARVWDALATTLPGTSATDDLGLITGTFLTGAPYIGTSDLKTAGATVRYARWLVPVTEHIVNALTLRLNAGMITAVADTACIIDAQVVRQAAPSTDICATAAQSMNSLTAANLDFVITPTNIVKGDVLDIRVAVTCTDAAGGSAVIAALYKAILLWGSGLDNQGHAQFIAMEANAGASALKLVYVNL